MKKLSLYLLLCFIGLNSLKAQTNDHLAKIDVEILRNMDNNDLIDCIILMKDQADVSFAKQLKTKSEKGAYVFGKLRANAQSTQKEVLEILDKTKSNYDAFYIVNAIRTTTSPELLREIAQLESVANIQPNPWTKFQGFATDDSPVFSSRTLNWNLEKLEIEKIWQQGYTGKGVIIGGQDTGYDWDNIFIARQYRGWQDDSEDHNFNWHDAISSISPLHEEANPNPSNNPCGLDLDTPCDDNGHGTYTMSLALGDDGTNDPLGLALEAQWIGCRNMERGWGSPASYIECFEWFLAPYDRSGNNANPE
ncbi:MAG: hypothetical protein AAFO07_06100, partial [Bacteroidota bacterium]